MSWSSKEMIGNPSGRDGHDMDIGGVPHVLFVDNLEKGISAVTIMQFLYQQVSVSCKAIVLPSKPSESYTRATIILDNKKNLEKLSIFLESPDRIIISSRGRPWVVTEEKLLDDTLKASVEVFKLTSQTALESTTLNSNDLKVANAGSREYRKAKMLKFLFKEFANHQCGLHQSLLHEERKILQLPM